LKRVDLREPMMEPGSLDLGRNSGRSVLKMELDETVHLRGNVFGWAVLVNGAIRSRGIVRHLLPLPMAEVHLNEAAELVPSRCCRLVTGHEGVQFLDEGGRERAVATDDLEKPVDGCPDFRS